MCCLPLQELDTFKARDVCLFCSPRCCFSCTMALTRPWIVAIATAMQGNTSNNEAASDCQELRAWREGGREGGREVATIAGVLALHVFVFLFSRSVPFSLNLPPGYTASNAGHTAILQDAARLPLDSLSCLVQGCIMRVSCLNR